ncbi:Uncharacterised protein [Escherichia coli]|nr:Uncharacterised protein [Escherichia coli]
MLIAVPANAVRFSSRRWQPPARAHPHNGTCRTCRTSAWCWSGQHQPPECQRQYRRWCHPTQPAYGWRCPASAGSLQALSHSIRRARLPYVRVTVAQRLVMGKGFFARHKHPLHWCVQQIVNGIRCRVTCSQWCRCPLHQTIQRSVTGAPVHSVVQLPECGGPFPRSYRGFRPAHVPVLRVRELPHS